TSSSSVVIPVSAKMRGETSFAGLKHDCHSLRTFNLLFSTSKKTIPSSMISPLVASKSDVSMSRLQYKVLLFFSFIKNKKGDCPCKYLIKKKRPQQSRQSGTSKAFSAPCGKTIKSSLCRQL